jgi:hypothetical protein
MLTDIADQLLGVYTTVVDKGSLPRTPGQASEAAAKQPSSPDADEPRLQLQENRVRLLRPPDQQQRKLLVEQPAGDMVSSDHAQQPPQVAAAPPSMPAGS